MRQPHGCAGLTCQVCHECACGADLRDTSRCCPLRRRKAAAGEALPSTSVAATLRGRAMRAKVALIASAIALVALGCLAASLVASGAQVTAADVTTANEPPTTVTQATTQSTSVTQTSATTVITPGPGQPSVILPDKKRTPGALNPRVRQSTIKKTICKSGWTKNDPAARRLHECAQNQADGSLRGNRLAFRV